jgi:hypothetical protein
MISTTLFPILNRADVTAVYQVFPYVLKREESRELIARQPNPAAETLNERVPVRVTDAECLAKLHHTIRLATMQHASR